jgi:hypothetical protein
MQDLCEHGKKPDISSKFWVEVSERMDKTRTAKQCHNKWYVLLDRLIEWHFIVSRNGSLPRWRASDSKILVQKYALTKFSFSLHFTVI